MAPTDFSTPCNMVAPYIDRKLYAHAMKRMLSQFYMYYCLFVCLCLFLIFFFFLLEILGTH